MNRFFILLLVIMGLSTTAKAEKEDPFHGDKVLFELNKQVYDSLQSPSFFKMQEDGLKRAVSTKNEFYYNTFRRAIISHYYVLEDKENFLSECDKLIKHYKEGKEKKSEKYLYDAWATKFDRLQIWGDHDQAIAVIHQMADYAQKHRHELGMAIVNFCFGQVYLDNRQPAEADKYYRLAYKGLLNKKEYDRALRAGFNLMAVQMNLNAPEKGLLISDDNAKLLKQWQAEGAEVNPVTLMKQALYRFRLLFQSGHFEAAEAQRDTMFYYNNIYKDPAQQEIIQYAVVCFEEQRGNYKEAYAGLNSLVNRFLEEKDYLKVARYRYELADIQREQGDYKGAMESYRQYCIDNDSANVQSTNSQLNELTKKFQLNELTLQNKLSTNRLYAAIVCIMLLSVAIVIYFVYTHRLRKKNRVLYDTIVQSQKMQDDLYISHEQISEDQLSNEEKLYRKLCKLIQTEELFKDSQIKREDLAVKLGTNRTYLADAIKQFTDGLTFMEFLNRYRLRHAATLLSEDQDTPINEIGDVSGFNSRSTFNRLFRDFYGMSPSEYRAISREKKVK